MANSLIFFAETVSSYSTFAAKKINVFENTFATTVNEFVINELVKLAMLCRNNWAQVVCLFLYLKLNVFEYTFIRINYLSTRTPDVVLNITICVALFTHIMHVLRGNMFAIEIAKIFLPLSQVLLCPVSFSPLRFRSGRFHGLIKGKAFLFKLGEF